MKELSKGQLEALSRATLQKTGAISLEHARRNLPFLKKTVADLPAPKSFPAAVVVCAGPSIHRKNPAVHLKQVGFSGPIVACDGAMGYLLRNGIVPDYVLSVDPHPDRIIRWFGDTKLHKRPEDDYFKRQDLDERVARDEAGANEEMIRLVNEHGRKIKAILATSVSPDIAERCLEAGMDIYWWNPIFDDYDEPGSVTRQLYNLNKAPCMVTGGNVGTSSWVFAHSVLGKPVTALLGMDFGYAPGTPLERTGYYEFIKDLCPDDPRKPFIDIYNPHLDETWFTDPAYYWYRQSFLRLVEEAGSGAAVYNCTEGGILFGERIQFTAFESFLKKFREPIPAVPHG